MSIGQIKVNIMAKQKTISTQLTNKLLLLLLLLYIVTTTLHCHAERGPSFETIHIHPINAFTIWDP